MKVVNVFKNIKILELTFKSFEELEGAEKVHLPLLETIKVFSMRQLSCFSNLTSLKYIKIKKSNDVIEYDGIFEPSKILKLHIKSI